MAERALREQREFERNPWQFLKKLFGKGTLGGRPEFSQQEAEEFIAKITGDWTGADGGANRAGPVLVPRALDRGPPPTVDYERDRAE